MGGIKYKLARTRFLLGTKHDMDANSTGHCLPIAVKNTTIDKASHPKFKAELRTIKEKKTQEEGPAVMGPTQGKQNLCKHLDPQGQVNSMVCKSTQQLSADPSKGNNF